MFAFSIVQVKKQGIKKFFGGSLPNVRRSSSRFQLLGDLEIILFSFLELFEFNIWLSSRYNVCNFYSKSGKFYSKLQSNYKICVINWTILSTKY